ncbi:hypothetical protein SAMN02799624_03059 [Paenibacillus sp. UNC496MF]|nr:hypothetical protein SAMN02799624_03059 [Paenibacillus sp. UNC496MF]
MNKHALRLILVIACLLLPIMALLYGIWDFRRPKTGPVGDGELHLSFFQLLPLFTTFLIWLLNLPQAVSRYREHRARKRR